MSWQQILDTQLLAKKTKQGWIRSCVESAAILDLQDCSVWACSRDFRLLRYSIPSDEGELEVDESQLLLQVLATGKTDPVLGLRISGLKYLLLRCDPARGLFYLRKQGGGGCLMRSTRALLFAAFSESLSTTGAEEKSQSGPLCNDRVECLAEFLVSKGF